MTGKTLGTLQRNVLQELATDYTIDVRLNKFNQFKLFGNTINCFGTDTTEAWKGITGFTSYGWYANEVNYADQECINEAIARCRGTGARVFWDCNPDAPNHFIKTQFIDKANELGIYCVHWVLEDNMEPDGFLPESYFKWIKSTIPSGVFYDRKILGLWTSAEGMIYKDWNPDTMVIPYLPTIRRYFAGVDWGFDHLGVIVVFGEDYDGNVYILKEIAETGRNIDWWLSRQEEIINQYGSMPFYCDSARPEYVESFRGIEASKEVIEGIEHVAGRMKKKKLYVIKGAAPNFEKEVYLYRWDNKSIKEQPIKRNDDSMDATRYALFSDSLFYVNPAMSMLSAHSIKENY